MEWILNNFLSIVTTLFGGTSLVALVMEKNKRRIEERQLSADALAKMQEAYAVFTEDSNKRYISLKQEMESELSKLKERLSKILEQLELEKIAANQALLEKNTLLKENELLHKELTDCKEKL